MDPHLSEEEFSAIPNLDQDDPELIDDDEERELLIDDSRGSASKKGKSLTQFINLLRSWWGLSTTFFALIAQPALIVVKFSARSFVYSNES